MIYTRKINDKTGISDYSGTSEELCLEILMTVKKMIECEDMEPKDFRVLVTYIFENLKESDKVILLDMLLDKVDLKGGNLWQELEDLSKSEKK